MNKKGSRNKTSLKSKRVLSNILTSRTTRRINNWSATEKSKRDCLNKFALKNKKEGYYFSSSTRNKPRLVKPANSTIKRFKIAKIEADNNCSSSRKRTQHSDGLYHYIFSLINIEENDINIYNEYINNNVITL